MSRPSGGTYRDFTVSFCSLTDLQSQVMVLLSLADGFSVMKETVFEGRFKHVEELSCMGADISTDLNYAFIRGVQRIYGATVEATDLRAGAALVIAGLAAQERPWWSKFTILIAVMIVLKIRSKV